jgi:hypothetical protein
MSLRELLRFVVFRSAPALVDDKESSSDSVHVKRTGCGCALIILIAILGAVVMAVIVRYFFVLMPEMDKRGHEHDLRFSQADMDSRIAAVKAGRTKSIYLYCSVGTDRLLERLRGVPELEELNLHLTDVSDAGLEPLASLPRLKCLVVYGGNPSVSDGGFTHITNIPSLECLKLVNTHVTDKSLPSLNNMSKLRTLVLYQEAFRGATFTDAGLDHLKALRKLKRLELTGGWASVSAVNELRKALPDCTIDTKSEPDADD